MALAQALEGDARFAPTYSVAGRTRAPRLPALPSRSGGFGGVAGLVAYLRAEGIALIVDATHPFATGMSANAAAAAHETGTPLLVLCRPPWRPQAGDRWQGVASLEAAAAALGERPRRVFLTTGKTELAPFLTAPQHFYLIRSVEAPERLPPRSAFLAARGPFSYADEAALLREHRIEILVSKNSGGTATAAKLDAARDAGIAVVMVERPPLPAVGEVAPDVAAALERLAAHQAGRRPTERGV
ncbi:precorrin-6x reductase [Thioflavicoccus mobilis 8321]|uniref:Precorrin-6x reductase n=2 Tax=Thioflavicoccus mobilis TaxID=80679 RepID=L0H3G5_9GAMM|nr:precorrin-6x reductase [Thioflavicoccus mobilis 8321]